MEALKEPFFAFEESAVKALVVDVEGEKICIYASTSADEGLLGSGCSKKSAFNTPLKAILYDSPYPHSKRNEKEEHLPPPHPHPSRRHETLSHSHDR